MENSNITVETVRLGWIGTLLPLPERNMSIRRLDETRSIVEA